MIKVSKKKKKTTIYFSFFLISKFFNLFHFKDGKYFLPLPERIRIETVTIQEIIFPAKMIIKKKSIR